MPKKPELTAELSFGTLETPRAEAVKPSRFANAV